MDMADRQSSTLTKLAGIGVLACSSGLAIHDSWGEGDAASVAFVLAADAVLVLLFVCLREFERARGGRMETRTVKAAVWGLTTLLTAMFATRAALLMPLAVGVLVFLCLRGGGRSTMGGNYYALAKVGLAVLACDSAVDTYGARRDPGAAALVLVSYAALVILTGLFVRAFARAHAGEQA